MGTPPESSTDKFERALEESKKAHYVLRLYVAGNTTKSTQAIAVLHEICETHLKGRYQLEVIDIYQDAHLARSGHVIAAPTLIKQLPLPLRRVVGDLSHMDRILVGLDLQPAEHPSGKDDGKSDG